MGTSTRSLAEGHISFVESGYFLAHCVLSWTKRCFKYVSHSYPGSLCQRLPFLCNAEFSTQRRREIVVTSHTESSTYICNIRRYLSAITLEASVVPQPKTRFSPAIYTWRLERPADEGIVAQDCAIPSQKVCVMRGDALSDADGATRCDCFQGNVRQLWNAIRRKRNGTRSFCKSRRTF